MMQSRTHNCGQLRLANAGENVTIVGWLENVREVGANFAFLVIRDFYGTTQVVVETEEMMKAIKGINKESTVSVTGIVRERESKNPKQATGDIEVVPQQIKVLGKCRHNQLPFEINKSKDADENVRLKYRYLDLRNPEVKKNIILRCQVVAAIRQARAEQQAAQQQAMLALETQKNQIAAMSSLESMHLDNFCAKFDNGKPNPLDKVFADANDAAIARRLATPVFERAAILTAIHLAAFIVKTGGGQDKSAPVCVCVDGSTYHKTRAVSFPQIVQNELDQMLGPRNVSFELTVCPDNAPLVGAAVAALLK